MNDSITYRPGALDDSYAVFSIFEETLADLNRRLGSTEPSSADDTNALARMWAERQSLYDHLARAADQFWIAERRSQSIGFARSTLRDGLQQLTELFVLPDQQSGGVGRGLLDRAFPPGRASYRSIITSADHRAQALYLKAGLRPRFPVYYFGRKPENTAYNTDLTIEPITLSPDTLRTIGAIDDEVLGFRRDVDHAWLLSDRQGYIYLRDNQPIGYGYVGVRSGPFALLETNDYAAVLAHAESEAATQDHEHFGIEVPMVNDAAVDHLMARGYRLDSFIAVLMSNKPFGRFENYVTTSPPFFF